MSSGRPRQDVVARRRLEAELEAKRIRVYRNLLGQPYVVFDVIEKTLVETQPAIHLYLLHDDVRGWLTQFIWEAEGTLLHQCELDRVLQALAGLSLRHNLGQVDDPALLVLLETEPTVTVIVEFMHAAKRSRHEHTMESLWKTLRDFARERKLLARGRKRFPGGADVLSRKMNRYESVLKMLGTQFSGIRSNGRKNVLWHSDAPEPQSSTESAAPNSTTGEGLPAADDKRAILAKLTDKRRQ